MIYITKIPTLYNVDEIALQLVPELCMCITIFHIDGILMQLLNRFCNLRS